MANGLFQLIFPWFPIKYQRTDIVHFKKKGEWRETGRERQPIIHATLYFSKEERERELFLSINHLPHTKTYLLSLSLSIFHIFLNQSQPISPFSFFLLPSSPISCKKRKEKQNPSMESIPKSQEKENPAFQTTSNTSSNSSSSSSNGVPLTPKTIPRSETNIYPTTFIQADTSSFKQVVQMLTGSSETTPKQSTAKATDPSKTAMPPIKTGPKKPAFKLYERRNSLKNLKISPFMPGFQSNCHSGFSLRKPEILSPSMLDFPSLALSPVTPLIPDPFNRSPATPGDFSALEEKAIAEKGFYLHPSPITTPRESEPRLLPLFPETSPRLSSSSS